MIGLAVLAILYYFNLRFVWIEVELSFTLLIQLLVVGAIYSTMPDIDQPGSIINKYATVGLVGVILYSFYNREYSWYGIIAAAILGLLRLIEHRTLIHSLVGAVIISAPLLFLGYLHFVVGLVAFLVHIISDGDFSVWNEKDWW
jgi:hypothetical protein